MTVATTRMKRIEIIVEGQDMPVVRDILTRAGATGYTVIRDVAGMGQGGWHEGRLMFNDQASLVMALAVAPETAVARMAEQLMDLFATRPGVTFISDVEVLRAQRFAAAG
jgi:nitrogen regulatory protein PII